MCALLNLVEFRCGRRVMQKANGVSQADTIIRNLIKQISRRILAETLQRLPTQLSPSALTQSTDGGVNGGQCALKQAALFAQPIFWVNHFDLSAQVPRCAVELYLCALLELRHLRLSKMKKPEGQQPAPVLDFYQKRSSAAEGHGCRTYVALYDRVDLIPEAADRGEAGAILISQWKVKKQILQ